MAVFPLASASHAPIIVEPAWMNPINAYRARVATPSPTTGAYPMPTSGSTSSWTCKSANSCHKSTSSRPASWAQRASKVAINWWWLNRLWTDQLMWGAKSSSRTPLRLKHSTQICNRMLEASQTSMWLLLHLSRQMVLTQHLNHSQSLQSFSHSLSNNRI